MKRIEVSEEELRKLVSESISCKEVAIKLKLHQNSGTTYRKLNRLFRMYGINIEHFKKRLWNVGYIKNFHPLKIPLNQILIENSSYENTSSLKQRLIKENILIYECALCKNNGDWMGKTISLQLDHINGISNDNRLENLRLLCPNCHATTSNYCGRNKGKHKLIYDNLVISDTVKELIEEKDKNHKSFKNLICQFCAKEFYGRERDNKTFCSTECYHNSTCVDRPHRRKVKRPTKEQLIEEVKEMGYVRTGEKYEVSDQAIRKWLKRYGLSCEDIKAISYYKHRNPNIPILRNCEQQASNLQP